MLGACFFVRVLEYTQCTNFPVSHFEVCSPGAWSIHVAV